MSPVTDGPAAAAGARPESLEAIVAAYDAGAPLARARTPPAAWYTDPRIHDLELRAVFGGNWLFAARLDQLAEPGRYVTTRIGDEPLVLVRGTDGVLRAFFNVCRHHAAEVMTEPEGSCSVLRCPYHAWTYELDGRLRGTPELDGVEDFDRAAHGLVPVRADAWAGMAWVNLSGDAPPLAEYLDGVGARVDALEPERMRWFERRSWTLECNWKVYVDNYLDGGYHVPFLHKGLAAVLENKAYTIENEKRACLQWSPMTRGRDETTNAVRRGDRAHYWWIHPNFMLNRYEGVVDTNVVYPLGPDRCLVVFDFWFEDVSPGRAELNRKSVEVGERVQQEDVDICESVQRGLRSRAYETGRLSVRRETGEHLFHRLLHADLARGLAAR